MPRGRDSAARFAVLFSLFLRLRRFCSSALLWRFRLRCDIVAGVGGSGTDVAEVDSDNGQVVEIILVTKPGCARDCEEGEYTGKGLRLRK